MYRCALMAIVYVLTCTRYLITLYTIPLHTQCTMQCTLQYMWTWSVWSQTGDVNTAWESDTPSVPVSAECHLTPAHASLASTQSSVSRCGDAAGALCASFPTLKGTGGHGHLSCLFSQHTAQGGQAGPGPSPLNSTGQLLSPWPNNGHCYHCLATQTRAGSGQVLIKDPVTLTLAIRELAFMKTTERKMGLSLLLSSFPAHFPILNSSPSFCPVAHLCLMWLVADFVKRSVVRIPVASEWICGCPLETGAQWSIWNNADCRLAAASVDNTVDIYNIS